MKSKDSQNKRYFLDGKRESEVTIADPLPDHDSFVKVRFPNGHLVNVEEKRLTEITELPKISSDEIDLEYPQKVSKITMEIFDAEKGETFTKWLEGEDAEIWNNWMRKLCYKAEELGMNPPWLSLRWNGKRTPKKK